LSRLQRILQRGLSRTAHLWPDIRTTYRWVHRAAHLLGNDAGESVFELRRAYRLLLAEMVRQREADGFVGVAVSTFLRVTKSYWSGLFACYQTADLPRTNNDLEHFFGSARYHERRATGRKGASPSTVVRGAVRLVAAVATRQAPVAPHELQPSDLARWRTLRQSLNVRHEARRRQLRFRRNPDAYLAALEGQLLRSALPS
jgi:hypothetical protein